MTNTLRKGLLAGVVILVIAGLGFAWYRTNPRTPPEQQDEALVASREASSFPAADEDYFRDMDQNRDGPVTLSPDEIKGRNTWIVWTAGNDRMWDTLGVTSVGALDFLKVLSSHPSQTTAGCDPARPRAVRTAGSTSAWSTSRASTRPTGPDPNRVGALARPAPGRTARPIRSRTRRSIPGVQIGSRGPDARTASRSRPARITATPRASSASACFRTPTSTSRRRKRWDAERYYTDPTYYNDTDARAAVPRRHVVRVLPRRPESDQAAGRSRTTPSGPTSARTSARSTSGSTGSSTRRPTSRTSPSSCSTRRGRVARHLVRLDRQHQQPADDERGVLICCRGCCTRSAGARRRWPAAG